MSCEINGRQSGMYYVLYRGNFSLPSTTINIRVGRYKKIDIGVKFSLRSWEHFVSFLLSSPVLSRRSWEPRGARRKRGKKKKKVYKIFKSTETSPIACGNKFPLTFYFRFVRNGSRMERCTNERWGRRKKKLQKEKGRRKVTEMPEGNIEERFDDGRRPLCALEKLSR